MTRLQRDDLLRLAVALQRAAPRTLGLVAAAWRSSPEGLLLSWSGGVLPRLVGLVAPSDPRELGRLTRSVLVNLEPLSVQAFAAIAELLQMNEPMELRRCIRALQVLSVELESEDLERRDREEAQGFRTCRCTSCGAVEWKMPEKACSCRAGAVAP